MIRVRDLTNAVIYACAGFGYLAVARHASWASTAGFWLLFAAGAARDFSRVRAAPRWLLNLISLGVLAVAFGRSSLDFLVEPVLDALLVLVGIKLLEEKRNRDHLQILALCAFLLVGASLLSIHAAFLAHYVLLAFWATLALVCLTFHSRAPDLVLQRERITQCLLQGALICALAIPASGLFFVILPRTDYPLLTFLNKPSGARTGFSDSITLGQVAAIQEDESVIFRAEMDAIDDQHLYWRGVVLDVFEGSAWKSSRPGWVDTHRAENGEWIEQVVYLEPYGGKSLFGLDRPVSMRIHDRGGEREVTQLRDAIVERMRYRVDSSPRPLPMGPDVDGLDPNLLQLPDGFSPRIRELVARLTPAHTSRDKVVAIFNHLRNGGFSYTLEDLPVSSTPLEDFIMVHHRGNCEYFASALGVMLRMAGVPARLVGGYRGGLYNPSGRYYLVRQKNAHVWVEALVDGRGWLRLDPTPSTLEPGDQAGTMEVLGRVRVLMDTFNHYWIKLVINYDLEQQFRILRGMRDRWRNRGLSWAVGKLTMRDVGIIGGGAVAMILFMLLLSMCRKGPERKLIDAFVRRMKKRGYVKGPSDGLDELVAGIGDDAIRMRAARFAEGFQEIYYRDRSFSDADRRRLRAIIRGI
ncbi:MAG: DUF3488 and DUF4129 domain-containing transglutaminase family protein [Syntrophobacteraceae bacterium]|jgi:hypothetical protein|nr:DUF3488 and DUF4129 domain-containing transglutaminase family protein [Syntrophobacteraceae bacterium]